MRDWAGPAAVAAVCFAGAVLVELRESPVPVVGAGASAEATALLGGLREGERVAGWTVLGVVGPQQERIRIDFGRDDVRFAVTVAPLGSTPDSPAMQTDLHALYYGHAHPNAEAVPSGATRALLANIARRVRANER